MAITQARPAEERYPYCCLRGKHLVIWFCKGPGGEGERGLNWG